MIPTDIELRDGATYIVLPRKGRNCEQTVDDVAAWQRNHTKADERMLVARAINELNKDPKHTNVRPWGKKTLTGPDGWSAEVDAVAIADGTNQGCAIIVKLKNVIDSKAALQLIRLLANIDAKKGSGKGTVAELSGLVIKGALAGARLNELAVS